MIQSDAETFKMSQPARAVGIEIHLRRYHDARNPRHSPRGLWGLKYLRALLEPVRVPVTAREGCGD